MHVPIAHLHGGEVTLGAIDETFRHAITKMAHLHFTAADTYRDRVVQMGEAPTRVFNVGAVGLDNFSRLHLPSAASVLGELDLPDTAPFLLVTHHPATQEPGDACADIDALAAGLDVLPEHSVIFTKANADPGGRLVNARLEDLVRVHPDRMRLVSSLGQVRYLAAMKGAAAVVGNSSSGIIEAPAVDVPTVNIGRRQDGRLRALSVIDVAPDAAAIAEALCRATDPAFLTRIRADTPPYGRSATATAQIVSVLERTCLDRLLPKPFHDLATAGTDGA
jgi:UDP-N-acetylglucosamine 2-epimerase (non-hydrolysing)/GDP/UDP-N,N'-diacetylbacillosamine 2-epimerase (hydrolysing)